MAKNKYDETFPLRAEQFARRGLSDKQIADLLGIAESTYYAYQNEHKEFLEAIKRGKAPVDSEVENALLKRALGYEYEERTTEVSLTPSGEQKPSQIRIVKKQVPPDVGAIAFWLKNRSPKFWRDRIENKLITDDTDDLLTKEEFLEKIRKVKSE